MTRASARTAANLVLAAAGAAAAYVVITTPPLRRAAERAVRLWLGAVRIKRKLCRRLKKK